MRRLPAAIAIVFAAISILASGCASPAEKKYAGKSIAVILPDNGMKYLSTPMYQQTI